MYRGSFLAALPLLAVACGSDESGGSGGNSDGESGSHLQSDDESAVLWVPQGATSADADIELTAEHGDEELSYRLEPGGLTFEPTAGLFVRIPAAANGGTWLPLGGLGETAEDLDPLPSITLSVAALAGVEHTWAVAPVPHFSQASFIPGAVLVLPFELPRAVGEQWDSHLTVAPNANSNFTIRAEASGAVRLREEVDVGLLFPLGLDPQLVTLPLECVEEGEGRLEVDVRQESVVIDDKDRSGRAWLSREVRCLATPEQASALPLEGDDALAEVGTPLEELDGSSTGLAEEVRQDLSEMLAESFEAEKRAIQERLALEEVRHRPSFTLSCTDCEIGALNPGTLRIESDRGEALIAWGITGTDPGLHVGLTTQEPGPAIEVRDVDIPLAADQEHAIEFEYVCREAGVHALHGGIFVGDAGWPALFHAPSARITCNAQCTPQDAALAALLQIAEILDLPLPEFGCTPLQLLEIVHSAVVRGTQEVARDHTTWIRYGGTWMLFTQLLVDTLFNNSDFPCGEGENGYTLCASTDPVPEGEYLVLHGVLQGNVPLDHATNHYQYGFVFDADGDTTNNYQPSAEYANDFFKDTDRWYAATYSPSGGWTLEVTDATNGVTTPVASNARLILKDNAFVLLVPRSEFAAEDLLFRITAFRHTGDFGLMAPYDWDGSVYPAVADGLAAFPPQ